MSLLARAARLSPFGPIFAKELRTTARRKRSYALRVGYLGLLLLAMLLAYLASYANRSYGGRAAQTEQQAELGLLFFRVFSCFCIFSMGLIGPVLTATAVGSERLQKTLPVLLMTPINTWQILGGKLFSRMLAALTLLGLSLPVLALVRLLGGVELGQMASVLCLSAAYALSSAATGLFFSTLMNRAYAVILLGYAAGLFLYAFVPFVLVVGFDLDRPQDAHLVAALNPLMCAMVALDFRGTQMLGDTWIACVGLQLALTVALVAASGLALRRSARNAGEREATVDPAIYIPLAAALSPATTPQALPGAAREGGELETSRQGAAPDARPGQSDDQRDDAGEHAAESHLASGQVKRERLPYAPSQIEYASPAANPSRLRGPGVVFWGRVYAIGAIVGMGPWSAGPGGREVSDRPILWREVRRPLLGKSWQRILAILLTLGVLFALYVLVANENHLDDPDLQIGFAIGMHGLMWLLIGVFAATAIASEKESDTWTLLLASPVSGAAVVWGKAAGLARRLTWPTILVFGHFALFALFGVIHPMSIVFVLWVMIAFNSVWLATGLYLSLRMKRVTTSVMANLLLTVLAYGLPLAVLFVASELSRTDRYNNYASRKKLVEQGLWTLPYFYLAEGMETLNDGWGREARWQQMRNGNSVYAWQYNNRKFYLPGDRERERSGADFGGYVVAIGCLHLALAALILTRTAKKFDQIVGRAGRLAYVGAFDTDDAVFTPPANASDDSSVGSAGAMTPAFVVPYASVVRRAIALAIDAFILISSGAVLGLLAGVVRALMLDERAYMPDPASLFLETMNWGILASLVYGLPYAAFFDSSRWRATPGKSMLGLFVTDAEGRRIRFLQAAWRYVARLLSLLPLAIGLLIAAFDPKRRTLHDRLADTLVLRR